MPPKGKTQAQKGYPDQTLAEITVDRARKISTKLGILNPGKYVKDQLISLIRDKLAAVEVCQPCGGGPCRPEEHVFPAESPVTEDLGSESDDSSVEASDFSPHRSALAELNKTTNSDQTIPGAAPAVSFAQHVRDQFVPEEPTDQVQSGSSGQPPPHCDSFEMSFSDASVQQQSEINCLY